MKQNKKRRYEKPAMRVLKLNPVMPLAQSMMRYDQSTPTPTPYQW